MRPQNADKLTSEIHIVVSRASAEAIARVEALGGSVTTRYYSPTSIKRVLSQESHPVISLQTGPELLNRAIGTERKPNSPFRQLSDALSSPDTPTEVKHKALSAVMETLRQRYKYRLPDPAGRRDIEYYRDPAHRGYLSYTVKQGESPSLFFKPPREGKDKRKLNAKKAAAKASAENRLF
jgi:large subunit ribosomal protein L15